MSLVAMAWRSCATCILLLGVLGRVTAVASDVPTTETSSSISITSVTNTVDPVTTKIVASRRVAEESSGRFGGSFRNPNQDQGAFKGTGYNDNPGQFNAEGVECYSCSNCATVDHLTPKKRCPSSRDPSKANKCVMFSQIYNALNGTWWVRGCPQERGSCQDIQTKLNHPSIVRVDTCLECDGDLCNSGFLGQPLAFSMATLAMLTCLAQYIVSY